MGNPLKRKKALKIELMKQASAGLQTPAQEEVAPQPEAVVEEVVSEPAVEQAAPAESAPEGEVRTSKYKRKVQ